MGLKRNAKAAKGFWFTTVSRDGTWVQYRYSLDEDDYGTDIIQISANTDDEEELWNNRLRAVLRKHGYTLGEFSWSEVHVTTRKKPLTVWKEIRAEVLIE